MTISNGDKIPSVTLKRLGAGGMEELNIAEYIAGRKVVIFGVPGAFTPACSQKHLPGYIKNSEEIKANGVSEIICVAVNDPFVMQQWERVAGAMGKVTFLPDGNGELTRALGLEFDGSGAGLGNRCRRFSLIADDGVVSDVKIEDAPGNVEFSSAEVCMTTLKSMAA